MADPRLVDSDLAELLKVGSDARDLSQASSLLAVVANRLRAEGCILWSVSPRPVPEMENSPPSGFLHAIAASFAPGTPLRFNRVPIAGSPTGEVIVSQRPSRITDLVGRRSTYRTSKTLIDSGLRAFAAVPVTFADDERGALSVYRRRPVRFSREDEQRLAVFAGAIPAIHVWLWDRIGLRLVSECDEILQKEEAKIQEDGEPFFPVLDQVCERIAATLSSREVSIFLDDPIEHPGLFRRKGRTELPPGTEKKEEYTADEPRLTSAVIRTGRPLWVFNLLRFDDERPTLATTHPGSDFDRADEVKQMLPAYLHLPDDRRLPPLTFLGVPIEHVERGDSVLGVLRCSTPLMGPFSYGRRELELLTLVARQLGRFVTRVRHRRQIEEDNSSLNRTLEALLQVNQAVHERLDREPPQLDLGDVFDGAVSAAHRVVSDAYATDIRLPWPQGPTVLRFAHTAGPGWEDGTPKEQVARKQRLFPLDGGIRSVGASVFDTGKPYVVADTEADTPDPNYSETFPKTKWLVSAPIVAGHRVRGVLDMRGRKLYRPPTLVIARLLSQQLGTYVMLREVLERLQGKETELETANKSQLEAFEDLEHQLRSPAELALRRLGRLLRRFGRAGSAADANLQRELFALRGLNRKIRRVSRLTRLFVAIAKGESLAISAERLTSAYCIPLLVGFVDDARLLVDPAKNVRFQVQVPSFEILDSVKVLADRGLLEQCLGCLVDNAGKYSYPDTEVDIFGRLTHTGRFQITISSVGARMSVQDTKDCIIRGWRGDEAKTTTGEGSGIGLWLVHHIMEEHRDGKLIVNPTDAQGRTRVQLVFPVE